MGYYDRREGKRIRNQIFWFGVIALSLLVIYGIIEDKEKKDEESVGQLIGRCFPVVCIR